MNSSTASPLLFLGAPGLIGNQVIPTLIKAGFSVLAGSRRRLSVGGAPGVGVDMQDFSAFYGETIRTTGTIFLPLGDARVSHLDLRDLAEAAVAALRHDRHLNKTYDLSGPEALHTSEVAEQIGSAIGRTIQYQPIPVAAMEASLREAGMDPWFAEGLAELYGWIRDSGLGSEVTEAAEQLLGRKAIAFRQFAIDERSAWLD